MSEIKPTYEELAEKVQQQEIQERVFRSVIEQLETVYTELASVQTEIEQKNLELEEERVNLKLANEKLQKMTETAEEASRAKSDFINTVSHELRTPLTSILGFARIIRKKLEGSIFPLLDTGNGKIVRAVRQIRENIEIIVLEGDRLTNLINDVLDLAKMEAGKITWSAQRVSVPEIIERATAATASLFEHKGLTLEKEIEEGLPEITGDKDRLIQVLINLISNAVKFTDKGSILCKARKEDWTIVLSVSDSGIGISEEDQPKVFEKFKQVGDTLTDKPKGTGLGLPICREIVEHHGGRIWVESEPGKGSTFFFSLPFEEKRVRTERITMDTLVRRLKEQMATMSVPVEGWGKSILVVDDDPSIRKLLRQEFESQGFRVIEAGDGLSGVNAAKNERPDLIILDVMMPEMNGFDAAAVIKNDPLTMHIPIIMLSIVEDKERGYRIGVDRYFSKPFDIDALLRETSFLISRGASHKKVLVVDEDESTVRTLTEVLEARGHSVVNAFNGKDCIDKAVSIRPDMIIINTMLSESRNIIKALRYEKGLESVYFIFIEGTGGSDGEDIDS